MENHKENEEETIGQQAMAYPRLHHSTRHSLNPFLAAPSVTIGFKLDIVSRDRGKLIIAKTLISFKKLMKQEQHPQMAHFNC